MFRAAARRAITLSPATRRCLLASARSSLGSASAACPSEDSPGCAFLALALVAVTALTTTACENTPSGVSSESIEDAPEELDNLPVFTMEQVSLNNGENGRPIWMSYGGMVRKSTSQARRREGDKLIRPSLLQVYDVTDFVVNHPGGSEKIMQAAGNVSLSSSA